MKKINLFLAWTLLSAVLSTVYGQQLYKCNSKVSYWTFEKNGSFFSVKLEGKIDEQDRKSVLSIEKRLLQYLIVNKNDYIKTDGKKGDLDLLVNHAMSETEHFTQVFKQRLDIQLQKVPLNGDKFALVWFFKMPQNISTQVEHQVFLSVISGDKIFGLSGTQFVGQNLDETKNFLTDVIATLKSFDNKSEFDKLCLN